MKPWLHTRDMMGREVGLAAPPERIVSVVPSQTELLYDLGLEQEVIGITKFCVHPEKWFQSKERIGGTKKLNIEKIAALKPDLILANKEENEKSDIAALEGIAPVWLSDIATLPEALTMIEAVGVLCNRSEKGLEIADQIRRAFAGLEAQSRDFSVAYAIWKDPWMWAAGGTFIHDLIHRLGWQNILTERARYPEVSLEEIREFKPDLILLSSEPYPFGEKHFPEIKAVYPEANILLTDGEMFSWYGSRLIHSASYLRSLQCQAGEAGISRA